ncbi:glycosyltransferase family 2 protein [Desulfovibrionales bacterium]
MKISISIISHLQKHFISNLIECINKYAKYKNYEILLTINMHEENKIAISDSLPLRITYNTMPKGFGANHNAAFRHATGDFFCVLNPDIRLVSDPFPALVDLASQDGVGVVAPEIFDGAGHREDSARYFPTPFEVLGKVFGGRSATVPDLPHGSAPDWVAGMFMLFPRKVFEEVGGFDERYFLYYEDVDICARLALAGYKRLVCADAQAIHDAQRSSHHSLRYTAMHMHSMWRFFTSDVYRKIRQHRKLAS